MPTITNVDYSVLRSHMIINVEYIAFGSLKIVGVVSIRRSEGGRISVERRFPAHLCGLDHRMEWANWVMPTWSRCLCAFRLALRIDPGRLSFFFGGTMRRRREKFLKIGLHKHYIHIGPGLKTELTPGSSEDGAARPAAVQGVRQVQGQGQVHAAGRYRSPRAAHKKRPAALALNVRWCTSAGGALLHARTLPLSRRWSPCAGLVCEACHRSGRLTICDVCKEPGAGGPVPRKCKNCRDRRKELGHCSVCTRAGVICEPRGDGGALVCEWCHWKRMLERGVVPPADLNAQKEKDPRGARAKSRLPSRPGRNVYSESTNLAQPHPKAGQREHGQRPQRGGASRAGAAVPGQLGRRRPLRDELGRLHPALGARPLYAGRQRRSATDRRVQEVSEPRRSFPHVCAQPTPHRNTPATRNHQAGVTTGSSWASRAPCATATDARRPGGARPRPTSRRGSTPSGRLRAGRAPSQAQQKNRKRPGTPRAMVAFGSRSVDLCAAQGTKPKHALPGFIFCSKPRQSAAVVLLNVGAATFHTVLALLQHWDDDARARLRAYPLPLSEYGATAGMCARARMGSKGTRTDGPTGTGRVTTRMQGKQKTGACLGRLRRPFLCTRPENQGAQHVPARDARGLQAPEARRRSGGARASKRVPQAADSERAARCGLSRAALHAAAVRSPGRVLCVCWLYCCRNGRGSTVVDVNAAGGDRR